MATTFYGDETKLTFDEAELLVLQYLGELDSTRHIVKAHHVLRAYDVPQNQHNVHRVVAGLTKWCEMYDDEDEPIRSPRFVIPDEFRDT